MDGIPELENHVTSKQNSGWIVKGVTPERVIGGTEKECLPVVISS